MAGRLSRTSGLIVIAVLLFSMTSFTGSVLGQQGAMKTGGFKPVLENVLLEAPAAWPGEKVGVVYYFRNAGAARADRDYRVFVHFERTQSWAF